MGSASILQESLNKPYALGEELKVQRTLGDTQALGLNVLTAGGSRENSFSRSPSFS